VRGLQDKKTRKLAMANSRVQSQVFQIEYDIWHPTIVTNNDVRNAYCVMTLLVGYVRELCPNGAL